MDPVWKKEWVEALRSGRYTQRQGYLRLGDCFCALGVLCDVYDASRWDKDPEGDDVYLAGANSGRHAVAPEDVLAATGLTHAARKEVTRLNDGDGLSFAGIADWVEANL